MSENTQGFASRREFLKHSGRIAAASALAGMAVPHVHAAEDNTIRLALIGCGGRGTGAVVNALSVPNGPIKLVAMADVFADRLNGSCDALKQECGDKIDVPEDRKFLGFDAYQKGDGLPQAGRRRHFDHSARLPLGAVRLRDRKGHQRLHGEARYGRWPDHQKNARPRRRIREEKPQGRRRTDVPPLPRPAGAARTHPRRPDRRHRRLARPIACTARSCGFIGRKARRT